MISSFLEKQLMLQTTAGSIYGLVLSPVDFVSHTVFVIRNDSQTIIDDKRSYIAMHRYSHVSAATCI